MASSDNLTVPRMGSTMTYAASTTSLNKTIPPDVSSDCPCIRVFNEGAATAYIRWGSGAQTATAADVPVGANSTAVFFIGQVQNIAVVLATGTANVYVTPCSGSL